MQRLSRGEKSTTRNEREKGGKPRRFKNQPWGKRNIGASTRKGLEKGKAAVDGLSPQKLEGGGTAKKNPWKTWDSASPPKFQPKGEKAAGGKVGTERGQQRGEKTGT